MRIIGFKRIVINKFLCDDEIFFVFCLVLDVCEKWGEMLLL